MKKLIFLGACLLALGFSPVKAQTAGPAVVTVRIVMGTKRVYVATSSGLEKTEMNEVAVPLYPDKNNGVIADIYQQMIAKLSQQGYTLKGMSGGDVVTTLVFSKEK